MQALRSYSFTRSGRLGNKTHEAISDLIADDHEIVRRGIRVLLQVMKGGRFAERLSMASMRLRKLCS